VFKVTYTVSNAIAGEPVDLTTDYTSDDSGTDPDVSSGAESVTVVSYSDKNQRINDMPWSISGFGNNDGDNLAEENEKAEITVWLLDRNNSVSAIGTTSSTIYSTVGGMISSNTVLTTNDEFTIEMKPPSGAVLNIQRTTPSQFDTVMDLN
jgi:archaellin